MAGSNGTLSSLNATMLLSVDTNPPAGSISVYVGSIGSQTLTFEASTDANSATGSANWFVVGAVPLNASGAPYGPHVTTTTTTGTWIIPNLGFAQVRARVSTQTSGSAYVSIDGSGASLPPILEGDTVQAEGTQSAPTAGTVIATCTPGTAGTYEILVYGTLDAGSPAAAERHNMQLRFTSTVISKLANPPAAGEWTWGPFRVTIGASDTINVNAVGNATASVVYGAEIIAKRVA